MLKKFLYILLAFYVILISAGVTINRHYCMDRLMSFSLYAQARTCTDNPGAMASGCCHNEHETYQLVEKFFTSNFHFDFNADFTFLVPQFTLVIENLFFNNEFNVSHADYAPPLLTFDIHERISSFLL